MCPAEVTTARKPAAGGPVAAAPGSNAELFKFLQKLINDMYEDFELPGFPDVVVRLHRTLGDSNSSVREVVRLVSAEPSLSAKLLHLANSAAFNPGIWLDSREIYPRMNIILKHNKQFELELRLPAL